MAAFLALDKGLDAVVEEIKMIERILLNEEANIEVMLNQLARMLERKAAWIAEQKQGGRNMAIQERELNLLFELFGAVKSLPDAYRKVLAEMRRRALASIAAQRHETEEMRKTAITFFELHQNAVEEEAYYIGRHLHSLKNTTLC